VNRFNMNSNNNNNSKKQIKKKAPKKFKGVPVNLKKGSGLGTLVHLGKCSHEYASCLGNPFNGPLACIPIHPAQLSKKVRNFVRGTFQSQTSNGIAYIAAWPEAGVVNDQFSIIHSLPSSTTANWFDFSAAGQGFDSTNAEYSETQIGLDSDQFEFRVVGSGLRIRYTGTELNRGGEIVGICDANHVSLFQRSLADINKEEVAKKFSVDRKWKTVLYRPVENDDFQFASSITSVAFTDTEKTYYMGFALQSPAGVSVTFEYEFFSVYELFGKNIRAMTVSNVDAVGFSAVHSVAQLGNNLLPTELEPLMVSRKMVIDSAKHIASEQSHVSIADMASVTNSGLKLASTLVKNADNIQSAGQVALDAVEGVYDFFSSFF